MNGTARNRIEPIVAAIVLAAGSSKRMGKPNKLAATISGKSLVQHVVEAICASCVDHLVVVTGHERHLIVDLLDDANVDLIHNPDFENGLSSSIKVGLSMIGPKTSHALIVLGDMPFLKAEMINRMIGEIEGEASIVVATHNDELGNPVLWPRSYFEELANLGGDKGAKPLLLKNMDKVVNVEIGEAASFDIDTLEALELACGEVSN